MFLFLFSQYAVADELTLSQVNKGEWKILDSSGQSIGILKSIEDGGYSVQYTGGEYLGVIASNGELRKTGRHPTFTETDANLYLDVLKAIKRLK